MEKSFRNSQIWKLFKGNIDRYRGVTVDSKEEFRSEENFEKSLENSLNKWISEDFRAVWFNIYLEHSYWIPVLAKNKFQYHHAKPMYVSMVRWLPKEQPNPVPCYAHTTIGVGAFVLNDNDELLVVQELAYRYPHWKLPGGYLEPGEELADAAKREVEEETGITTDFVSLIGFRHMHKTEFQCSNMYYLVHLRPRTNEITKCSQEIADCRWMKLEEYQNHELVNSTNQLFAKKFIEARKSNVFMRSIPHTLNIGSFSKDETIYYIDCSNLQPET